MARYNYWLLPIVLFVFQGHNQAQTQGQDLTCTANVAVPPALRAEGMTELIGDVVIHCTGGPGVSTPYNFGVALFAGSAPITVTSRITGPPNGAVTPSEALMLIDEPAPAEQQANQNVFQGHLTTPGSGSLNTVTWLGIPVLPPATSGAQRVFRLTNIRANVAGLPGGTNITGTFVGATADGSTRVQVTNPSPVVGFIQSSLSTSLMTPTGLPLVATPQLNASLNLPPTGVVALNYKELFGTAFKTRVTVAPGGTPLQNNPGKIYNSESGFVNPNLSFIGGTGAGLADYGTRLKAVFNNVPQGVSIFVPPAGNLTATNGSVSGSAQQTTSELGPFHPGTTDAATGLLQVPLVNSSGTVVWEVLSSNALSTLSANFPVFVTYSSSISQNLPPSGVTATVNLSYAPTALSSSTPVQVPTFIDTSTAMPLFNICSPCSGSPLLPIASVSAASFTPGTSIASPDSIVAGFIGGSGLNISTAMAPGQPLPNVLEGISVSAFDVTGKSYPAGISAVSKGQVNFALPSSLTGLLPATTGSAPVHVPVQIVVNQNNTPVAQGTIFLQNVAPALFTANQTGQGPAAAQLITVSPSGTQVFDYTSQLDPTSGKFVNKPIDFGATSNKIFLQLYGSGIRHHSASPGVVTSIGTHTVPVDFAGAQTQYQGLDQINIGPLPRGLAGSGEQTIQLMVDGVAANPVTVSFK